MSVRNFLRYVAWSNQITSVSLKAHIAYKLGCKFRQGIQKYTQINILVTLISLFIYLLQPLYALTTEMTPSVASKFSHSVQTTGKPQSHKQIKMILKKKNKDFF